MSNIPRNPHRRRSPTCSRRSRQIDQVEPPNSATLPLDSPPEPEQPAAPDETGVPPQDDADWEVFIADDDRDPLPEPGDFWDVEPPSDI
jgi:hypothetical protein